jgi:Ankyrin repeat
LSSLQDLASERLHSTSRGEQSFLVTHKDLVSSRVCVSVEDCRMFTSCYLFYVMSGAQVNKVGPGGRSALGEACRADNVKMVQMLLSQGADIEQPNPFFKDATPVTIGVICKNPQVVSALIEVGVFRRFNRIT